MIILITGASHTGKTMLAQKLLEKYHYPYLSIDHLKMGLIRSGCTAESLKEDNRKVIEGFQRSGERFVMIDSDYDVQALTDSVQNGDHNDDR